jgi:bifunctional UDP-N-acetylglucosamine pyrophosphorylase/glucosamine-1-phosphate N-acetyltransferase
MIQAIILAAGKGTRLVPLSETLPKPILQVAGTTILEHNLEQLQGIVGEVFIIIGYKAELIKQKIGNKYKNLKIKYLEAKQLGTGYAAKKALPFIKNRFLLLNGDDLYDKNDFKKILKKPNSILLKKVSDPTGFGQILTKNGIVKEIKEKPTKKISDLVNTGVYFLDKSIFDYKIQKSERGEFEFTDYIKNFIRDNKLYFVLAENWTPISYAWNLLDANEVLLIKIKKTIKGRVEKNATIKGNVFIGKGTIIKNGSYIEGPVYIGENCDIGPNCYIRPFTSIYNNCHIGQAVEIKNSIINEKTNIAHLSYVGDSIIGSNCNLGGGTIITNLRHDFANIKSEIKGELVDTKRQKFGAVIGDFVKTGSGTIIYPGRKIWPNKQTLPAEIIKKDIK